MLNRVEKMFDKKNSKKKFRHFFDGKSSVRCAFFWNPNRSKPVQTGPDRSKPVQTGPDVGPVWTGLDRFGICPKNGEINKNMFLHCIKTYFKVVPHVFLDLCFFSFFHLNYRLTSGHTPLKHSNIFAKFVGKYFGLGNDKKHCVGRRRPSGNVLNATKFEGLR